LKFWCRLISVASWITVLAIWGCFTNTNVLKMNMLALIDGVFHHWLTLWVIKLEVPSACVSLNDLSCNLFLHCRWLHLHTGSCRLPGFSNIDCPWLAKECYVLRGRGKYTWTWCLISPEFFQCSSACSGYVVTRQWKYGAVSSLSYWVLL
jgi:hypothetical protein